MESIEAFHTKADIAFIASVPCSPIAKSTARSWVSIHHPMIVTIIAHWVVYSLRSFRNRLRRSASRIWWVHSIRSQIRGSDIAPKAEKVEFSLVQLAVKLPGVVAGGIDGKSKETEPPLLRFDADSVVVDVLIHPVHSSHVCVINRDREKLYRIFLEIIENAKNLESKRIRSTDFLMEKTSRNRWIRVSRIEIRVEKWFLEKKFQKFLTNFWYHFGTSRH